MWSIMHHFVFFFHFLAEAQNQYSLLSIQRPNNCVAIKYTFGYQGNDNNKATDNFRAVFQGEDSVFSTRIDSTELKTENDTPYKLNSSGGNFFFQSRT